MYDVDGNGVIDQDEMTKIVQVDKNLKDFCSSSKLYQFNGFYLKVLFIIYMTSRVIGEYEEI